MEPMIMKCRQCGSPLKYVQGQTHIVCEHCGMEYVLQIPERENPIQDIMYGNQGVYFRSYVPNGWNARIFDDDKSSSTHAPLTRGLILDEPMGKARLIMYPFAYYHAGEGKGMFGNALDYTLTPTMFIRYRHLPDFETYVKERIIELNPKAQNIEINRMTDIDDFLMQKTNVFVQDSVNKLHIGDMYGEFGKYAVNFMLGQQVCTALFSSVIARKAKNKQVQNDDWMGKLKGMVQSAAGAVAMNWGRSFDAVMYVDMNNADACNSMFNDFVRNFQYGNLYYVLQQQELQAAHQIQMDAQRQQQQNAFAASQRLMQTQRETSNIITQGYQQRSAIMDRTRTNYSEAIRGVNSYTNTSGQTIEASVGFDHVYQNGYNYAGSKDGSADLGPDWVELKKK